jgi:hypothetical protein
MPQVIINGHHRQVAPIPAFLPSDIPGLVEWLSADCITLTGTTCSVPSDGTTNFQWSDRSGNANNAGYSSGTCTFHTNQINSLPAVTFSSCELTPPGFLNSSTGQTAFAALSATTAGGTFIGAAHDGFSYTISNGGFVQFVECQGVVNLGLGSGTVGGAGWLQINAVYTVGSAPGYRISQTTDPESGGTFSACNADTNAIGFDRDSGSQFYTGQLAEIIVYNSSLTLTQIQQVEGYLHSKYGI